VFVGCCVVCGVEMRDTVGVVVIIVDVVTGICVDDCDVGVVCVCGIVDVGVAVLVYHVDGVVVGVVAVGVRWIYRCLFRLYCSCCLLYCCRLLVGLSVFMMMVLFMLWLLVCWWRWFRCCRRGLLCCCLLCYCFW